LWSFEAGVVVVTVPTRVVVMVPGSDPHREVRTRATTRTTMKMSAVWMRLDSMAAAEASLVVVVVVGR
jgi:hypothetical protein